MDAVFLNSGGLDSLAVATLLHGQGHTLHSLYVDVGQLNNTPAKEAAQKIADKFCVNHKVVSLSESFVVYIPSLGGPGIAFQTCCVFLVGAMYAKTLNLSYIASGLKNNAASSDFSTRFVSYLNTSKLTPDVPAPVLPLFYGVDNPEKTPEEILAMVDFADAKQTYSCNSDPACMECVKCQTRAELGI